MKKILICIVAVALTAVSFTVKKSVIGTVFPAMECEDYNGKAVNLPVDTKGKYTLLCCAFSTAAEPDLFDVHVDYDVNLYFIPMFTGFNKLASNSSKDKIRKATDKELWPYLLFYDGGKTYKDELEFKKRDTAYFFVLDKNGKVVYTTSGKYDDKKMEQIIDIFEEN